MGFTGNFGSVKLEGDALRALGNAVEVDGSDSVSLHIAIVQNGNVAHGPAQVAGDAWTTEPPLPASGLVAGAALGLASQTLVTLSDGTLPSFTTFTWSENVTIAGEGE
jgi:hypothetical protein